ncbi:hypothetical protein Lesp02_53490 [Lentzea sp. NBRC 105346]|uniref:hypothetical protein n=1 Tax=Lentzea sp. NBRC 105346 TaxID=3032205 RepID=UPI0024A1D15D|nr:hypothetical protein [Lentzea sp. NBRC 105346]GLZ33161.1 hypothetical protein Lesp02_53490 [Lentzea sp. NBRC 105346]
MDMSAIRKYWGYLLLLVLLYGWTGDKFGPGVLAILSGFIVLYVLFQAPVWCTAETRNKSFCRNNAGGLLMGCHLREHKWQKFRMVVKTRYWGRLGRRFMTGIGAQAATFSAIAGIASAMTAIIALVVKKGA